MRLTTVVLTLSALAAAQADDGHSMGRYPRFHRHQGDEHHDHEPSPSSSTSMSSTNTKAFKPIDGGRRLDAFDDRMAGYEAMGKGWEQWAINQGYAPGPNSQYAAQHPNQAPSVQQAQAQALAQAQAAQAQALAGLQGGVPAGVQEVGNKVSSSVEDYEAYLDEDFFRQQVLDGEAWAAQKGYIPSYDEAAASTHKETPARRQLDAYDERMASYQATDDYYKALGEWEAAYWKQYAQGWVQWSEDKGYKPSTPANNADAFKAAFAGEEEEDRERDNQQQRRLDAFDDRMDGYKAKADYYQAVGEWEKQYWKNYADGWVKYTQDQGYMPSPESKIYANNNNAFNQQEITAVTAADKAAFAGEEDSVHQPEPITSEEQERQLQQQGEPNRYDAVAQGEASYWSKFGEAYAASGKGQAWMDWAKRNGYMPSSDPTDTASAAAAGQKDAASDAAQWTNYGNSWQGKGNSMGQGWVDWAQRQGYMPQPAAAAGGNGGAGAPAAGPGQQQRRLDAFDDRMARYEAIGKFEETYWKARGDAWAQWAVDEGFAPSADSEYAAKFRAQAAAAAASAGVPLPLSETEASTTDKRFTDLSAEDKAEAIRGDFYKQGERKSWADWLRDRTFGDDVAVVGPETYPPTEGYKGRDGPARAFIAEKLHMANVEAAGEVSPATFADVNMISNKAQEDVYKYDTFVGRSATRAFNGMTNGAEHVAKAAERTAERTYTMAGSRVSDAKEAYAQATDSTTTTKPVVVEEAKVAVPATPAVPVAAAPKHKNMRGGERK